MKCQRYLNWMNYSTADKCFFLLTQSPMFLFLNQQINGSFFYNPFCVAIRSCERSFLLAVVLLSREFLGGLNVVRLNTRLGNSILTAFHRCTNPHCENPKHLINESQESNNKHDRKEKCVARRDDGCVLTAVLRILHFKC